MRAELPIGWQWVPLSRLVSKIEAGKSFKCEERPPRDGEQGIVKVSAVTWGSYDEQESKTITDAGRVNEAYLIRPGDFLFSRANTLQLVGACVLVAAARKRLLLSDKILRLVMPDTLKPWVLWFLRSAEGRQQIESLSTGNQESMRNIGQERIGQIQVPLPAENTMQRIVSRIEELFSEIDEGKRALERVGRLVERYRQSVFKAAVSGELTREWRATSVTEPYTDGDKSLPPGWTRMRAEDLCGFITKGTTPPANSMQAGDGAIPYIKVYNLTFDGSLDFSLDPTFIDEATHRGVLARSIVKPGDVLMNIVGPPLGKVSIVPATHHEWNMNQAVCVFRPHGRIDQQFLAYYLLSRVAQDWLGARAKASVGQVNLTLQICRDLPVPIPPMAEQRAIVELVASKLVLLKSMVASIRAETAKSGAMRQSILKAAFSGQLVQQDPDDEPTAALLARMAAQTLLTPAATKNPRRLTSRQSSHPNPAAAG